MRKIIATAVTAAAALLFVGCDQISDQISEGATEVGQNAADRARLAAIDRLVEQADCRTLLARLADYEAGGHTEVVEYAREAAERIGCD